MTIDEAIKHAEEVADVCEFEASKYDMTDAYESHVACQEGKCAEEHRQLAEWLKELKQLKNQTSWIPVSEPPEEDGRYYVTRHDYVTQTDFIDLLWYEKGVWWNRQFTGDYAVIAWMPKPEPYKAESEEI